MYLLLTVTNHQMYVHEWPHQYQSHLQLYALRDSLRKEFENFKKEFFEEKNDHEQLQNKLKTTEKQQATTRKQHQELKHLCEILKQNEGNYNKHTLTQRYILLLLIEK